MRNYQSTLALSASASSRKGFALIISLSLMAFILVLLVALSTFVRIESQAVQVTKGQLRAQLNALLSIQIGMGDLQKHAGPDQRITGRAELLDQDPGTSAIEVNGAEIDHRFWTGIWSATDETADPLWLISGNQGLLPGDPDYREPDQALAAGDSVELVSERGDPAGNTIDPVRVPRVDLSDGDGSFAFWVADEGVKASVGLARDDVDNLDYGIAPARRFNFAGVSTLDPSDYGFAGTGLTTATEADLEDLPKIGLLEASNLIVPDSDFEAAFRHDATVMSYGVLANVRDGGLKIDLTSALRPPEGDFTGSLPGPLDRNDRIFPRQLEGETTESYDPGGPTWGQLSSFVYLSENPDIDMTGSKLDGSLTMNPVKQIDDRAGIHPVMTQVVLMNQAEWTSAAHTDGWTYVIPAVVLWNPHDVTLRGRTYFVDFGALGGNQLEVLAGDGSYFDEESDNPQNAPPGKVAYLRHFFGGGDLLNSIVGELAVPDMAPGESLVFSLTEMEDFSGWNLADTDDWRKAGPYPMEPGWRPEFGVRQRWSDSDLEGGTLPLGPETDDAGNSIDFQAKVMLFDPDYTFHLAETVADLHTSPVQRWVQTETRGNVATGNGQKWTSKRFRDGGLTDSPGPSFAPSDADGIRIDTGNQFPQSTTRVSMQFGSNHLPYLFRAGGYWANAPMRWLAQFNPRAVVSSPLPADYKFGDGFNSMHNFVTRTTNNQSSEFWEIPTDPTDANFARTLTGSSDDQSGNSYTVLFAVPSSFEAITSVGALMHASLNNRHGDDFDEDFTSGKGGTTYTRFFGADNVTPAYAIGGSEAAPFVPTDRTAILNSSKGAQAGVYDYSYLLNEALWDNYFFSTVPRSDDPRLNPSNLGTGTASFSNGSYRIENSDVARLLDAETVAAEISALGAFNLNSTSVAAWQAMLTSQFGVDVETGDGSTATAAGWFPRVDWPLGQGATDSSSLTTDALESYTGFRGLTSEQSQWLAEKVVEEVKARGPFRSVAEFVNRSLLTASEDSDDHRFRGPLASALLKASDILNPPPSGSTGLINSGFDDVMVEAGDFLASRKFDLGGYAPLVDQWSGHKSQDAPTYLTQQDILSKLGSVISVRSDTFLIRGYGRHQTLDSPATEVLCEAVVRRIPAFVNSSDLPESDLSTLSSTVNERFGRRFEIVSFRWIQKDTL